MADIQIFGKAGSPYTRAAILALEEKGQPFAFESAFDGAPIATPKTPQHLAHHPFGRIPVMRHGDFWLYETQAILRYVDAVFPGIALQPSDARQAARMNQLMGIVDWYFFPQVGTTLLLQRVLVPWRGGVPDEDICAAALPKAETCLGAIDELMADGPYVVGADVSLADLLLAPQMMFMRRAPEGLALLAGHPRIDAWLTRMTSRDSMARTEAIYGPPSPRRAAA